MTTDRVEKLADILVDYSVRVKKGDLVSIRGAYVAEPLLLAIYKRCIEREAYVMLRPTIPRAEPIYYRHAKDHQLEFIPESEKWLIENLTASFSVISDTNTRQLSHAPTEKQTTLARARRPLMDTYF